MRRSSEVPNAGLPFRLRDSGDSLVGARNTAKESTTRWAVLPVKLIMLSECFCGSPQKRPKRPPIRRDKKRLPACACERDLKACLAVTDFDRSARTPMAKVREQYPLPQRREGQVQRWVRTKHPTLDQLNH